MSNGSVPADSQQGTSGNGVARTVLLEGYTPDEVLSLSDDLLDGIALSGEPMVFRFGSAEVLGSFQIVGNRLVVELAQIEGGGEGVLPTLWLLTERYAERRGLTAVEWTVHAINCAKPNLKMRRVLERRGFTVQDVPEKGQALYLLRPLRAQVSSPMSEGTSVVGSMVTPCVKICKLDADSHYCIGCGRTLQEIGDWTAMTDDERRRVMDRLAREKETGDDSWRG